MSPHFLCERVRLLATCLQVVEELLKPRPKKKKNAVPSALSSGGSGIKVQCSLLYSKFKSSVNYMLQTKIVYVCGRTRGKHEQLFLDIEFQG